MSDQLKQIITKLLLSLSLSFSFNLLTIQATSIYSFSKHFNGNVSYQYAHRPSLHCIVECYHRHLPPFSGSPVVTSLRYDNESRTFTCTSTDGPATTVTWKRDGVLITLNATHQQTKRVVDSVAGTYQTLLTIDPSVNQSDIVGTYNCTVENARGRSSRMTIVGKLTLYMCHCYVYGMVAIDKTHSIF